MSDENLQTSESVEVHTDPVEEVPNETPENVQPEGEEQVVIEGSSDEEVETHTEAKNPDDEDDLDSVLKERVKLTRSQKTVERKWSEAISGDSLNPSKILELSENPILKESIETKAKEWGYDSAEAMIAEAKATVGTPKIQKETALSQEDIEYLKNKRQTEAKEVVEKSLNTEKEEYSELEKTELANLKEKGIDEASFKVNYRPEYLKERNALVHKGLSLKEAGELAFTKVKLKVSEAKDKPTPEKKPDVEMPMGSQKTTTAIGETPLTDKETYFNWDQQKKIAYIKQHKVKGVIQFA